MAAIHETAARRKDDGMDQIGSHDPSRMIGDIAQAWRATIEPAILIKFRDVSNRRLEDRQTRGSMPEPLSQPIAPPARNGVRMGLSLGHGRRLA